MATGDWRLDSCVIVVGEPGSELVRTAVQRARGGEFHAVPCGNVYSAVAEMAKAIGRRILVVGHLQELAGEDGVFFRIAVAHAVRCCCLLDHRRPAGPEHLRAALRAGVTMIGDVQDVGSVLTEWLTTVSSLGPRRGSLAGDEGPRTSDEGRATEAELRALLG